MTPKEALEIVLGNENSNYPDYEKARDVLKSAIERLGKYEKDKEPFPKKRYSYTHIFNSYFNGKDWGETTKNANVEKLTSPRIKELFNTYNDNGYMRIIKRVIIRDRWENDKVIFDGIDFEKFNKILEGKTK